MDYFYIDCKMASTRNKNTPGNYELEQNNMATMREYELYQGHTFHEQTCFPGNGLLPCKFPLQLFHNNCDIESELLGINSTNLVKPQTSTLLPPEPKPLPFGSIIDKSPVILPSPLVISKTQRYGM